MKTLPKYDKTEPAWYEYGFHSPVELGAFLSNSTVRVWEYVAHKAVTEPYAMTEKKSYSLIGVFAEIPQTEGAKQ